MKIPNFLKKKRTYAILAVVLLGVWFFTRDSGSASDKYETAVAASQTLVRTVEVTGEVKPAQRLDLAFENSGVVAAIHATVGQTVPAGTLLAELQGEELAFSLRRAEAARDAAAANLNLRLAGETSQAIRASEADVAKANAAYEKSQGDLVNVRITTANDVKTAELAVATAKSNLENAALTDAQSIEDARADIRTALFAALGPLQTGLSDGDKISGVDDSASSGSYRNLLGIGDASAIERSQQAYKVAKPVKIQTEATVRALAAIPTRDALMAAASSTDMALGLVQTFLTEIQKTLAATITGSGLTETELAAKKSQIDADRASVSAQRAAVATAVQVAVNAELGIVSSADSLRNAYDTAVLALEIAKSNAQTQVRTAESNITINAAAQDAAKAMLDLKKAGPRSVDLAPLQAALADAQVAYEQAEYHLSQSRIIAPVDSVVSEIIPELGERVTANAPAIRLVGLAAYDIEILLPESDVVKVQVGQSATVTLDAYGDSREFTGTVVSEEPDQTVVQDAVYYKARVQLTDLPTENGTPLDVKPGMTANVVILTAEAKDALVIPSRSVRTDQETGVQTVRVLVGDVPEDRTITTGLRGDEGLLQVLSGLAAEETIVVSERQ
ncbi:MAG: hypothetical protein RL141_1084 [Candidatus Parcubacteria bacterium]|jgi:RND family efflux transporter MFP subunit